jgi:hypothetical protein
MGNVDWIHLAQDRDQRTTLVNMVMNPPVPWKAGNLLSSLVTISFSNLPTAQHTKLSYSFAPYEGYVQRQTDRQTDRQPAYIS